MKLVRSKETGSWISEDGLWIIANVGGRAFNPLKGRTAKVWRVSLKPLGNLIDAFTISDAKQYINNVMSNRADYTNVRNR